MKIRVGMGYDVHRLVADRKLIFNQICLKLWRLQPVCWTIKNIEDHNTAKGEGYISIFEQFEP